MNAQHDTPAPGSTPTRWRWGTPPRSGLQIIIAPWEYRHLRGWASVRMTAGVVLASLGAITLTQGGHSTKALEFATIFLAAAAAHICYASWELSIARSASARNPHAAD